MTFGMAEEATIASAGDNRACSNERSGENECGSGERIGSRSRAEYGVPPRQNPYTMKVNCVVATTHHLRTNDLTMSKAL